jgi:autotransporter-associated beta strand protein
MDGQYRQAWSQPTTSKTRKTNPTPMKPKAYPKTTGISGFLLSSFLFAAASSAQAQTSTWNLTTGGSWNTGDNWTGGIPDSSTSIATFSQDFTGTPIVTLDKADGFTANRINYEDTGTAGDVALSINTGTGGKLILAGTTPIINAVNNLTINAALDGASTLTKIGAGTLTLAGTNTYSGNTIVSAGSVTVSGNHSGATGGWTINNGATSVSFAAGSTISVGAGNHVTTANSGGSAGRSLSVAGTVTTSSTSDLTIRGRNSVSINSGGSWTMQGGTLTIQPLNTSYGATLTVNTGGSFTYNGTDTIVLAEATTGNSGNGTLNLSGGTFTTTRGFGNSGAGNGAGTSNFNFSAGGTLKISNDIAAIFTQGSQPFNITTGTGGGVIDTNGFNTATSVGITGTGGMTKAGNGTLTLSGSNSYAGGTTISGGTLTFLNTTAKASNGTHAFGAGTTLGLGVSGTNAFTATDITNAFAGTMTGNLSNVTVTATTNVGINTANGDFTYSDDITGSPTRGLAKLGANTLTLSGANTYTGATLVSAGTLLVTGVLSNSAVTVEANGTIASNGTAGTLGNGLTIQAGGNLDLTGATLGSSSTGVLGLTGGSLTLGNLTFQDLVGWDWLNAQEGTYELIDGAFAIDWGGTAYLSEATAYDFGNGKAGYFASGSLNAVIVAIPEPRAALLGGLGLIALLRRRRG